MFHGDGVCFSVKRRSYICLRHSACKRDTMAQGVDSAFLSQCYEKPVMVRVKKEPKETQEEPVLVCMHHDCDFGNGCKPRAHGSWIRVAGCWKDVALWGEENFVAINMDGHVYKRVAGVLTQIDGVLESVVSDSLGSMWWGVNACGQLYKREGADAVVVEGVGSWTNVANNSIRAKSIVLNSSATKLFVLTRDGHVWVHTIESGHWKCVTPMGPLHDPHALLLTNIGAPLYIDTSRVVWSAVNTMSAHWDWERSDCVSDIESGCAGSSVNIKSMPVMYGITAQHTVVCFYDPRNTSAPHTKRMPETGRARMVTWLDGSLACINDAGEMFWRPRI